VCDGAKMKLIKRIGSKEEVKNIFIPKCPSGHNVVKLFSLVTDAPAK
jgi:hypothetical protein